MCVFLRYIGLSLLLVLCFAPRGFSGFPPSSKSSISKFKSDQEPFCGCATFDSLFIMFLSDT